MGGQKLQTARISTTFAAFGLGSFHPFSGSGALIGDSGLLLAKVINASIISGTFSQYWFCIYMAYKLLGRLRAGLASSIFQNQESNHESVPSNETQVVPF